MAELPQNWIESKLEYMVWHKKGSKPKKLYISMQEGYVPYIDIKAFEKNILEQYTEINLAKLTKPNNILVVWDGARAGLVGLAPCIGAIGSTLVDIEPKTKEIINKYLYYFLFSNYAYINSKPRGTGTPHVNPDLYWNMLIPLPPSNEQKRIVEKLDKMIRIVDDVNARLNKIPTALKRARQSILNQAITGELTKDWREKNLDIIPASIMIEQFKQLLLESSSKNERDNINNIFSYKENYFSFDIPHTWTFSILEKLCKSFKYGTSTKSESSGLVPVLRMGNIQKGEIDWNDLVYTSDSKEIEKYKLEKNDVLFNRTNSPELVGKTAIYRGERAAIYAGYLIKIENYKILNSEYLNYALNSTFAKEWKLDVKTDGVSQSNINAQKLAKFEVPLPPLEEQAEIVRRVKLAFEKLDKIESRYQKAKEYFDKLTQSILNKAFRGELVPQDPNDSPIKIPE